MNLYFKIAMVLMFFLGIVHSLMGEILIFNKYRKRKTLFPNTINEDILKNRHLRILWATWHLATLFAFALAIVLFQNTNNFIVLATISASVFISSLLLLDQQQKEGILAL